MVEATFYVVHRVATARKTSIKSFPLQISLILHQKQLSTIVDYVQWLPTFQTVTTRAQQFISHYVDETEADLFGHYILPKAMPMHFRVNIDELHFIAALLGIHFDGSKKRRSLSSYFYYLVRKLELPFRTISDTSEMADQRTISDTGLVLLRNDL